MTVAPIGPEGVALLGGVALLDEIGDIALDLGGLGLKVCATTACPRYHILKIYHFMCIGRCFAYICVCVSCARGGHQVL